MFKIQAPNFTQTPNVLFDEWLPHLGLAELKVLMVILRKTFGWHKVTDRISLSQLQKTTGLERRHVSNGVKGLISKGLIKKVVIGLKGFQETLYELIVAEDSNNFTQCPNNTPPSVLKTPTKETISKEKKKPPSPNEKKEKGGGGLSKDSIRKSLPTVSDEEFLEAWQEYQKAIPGSVKNIKKWIMAVVQRLRLEKKNTEDAERLTQLHKSEAEHYEKLMPKGRVVACGQHVELIKGIHVKIVKYNVTDEEWKKQTGWIRKDKK